MTPRILDRLAVGAGAMAAGLTLAPAFEPAAGVSPAVVITAVAVAVVLPRGWWALPFALTGPVVTTLMDGPSLPPVRLLVDGPGSALRMTLPLPPELVVVPALLTGVAAAAGAALLRRRPGGLEALLPAAATGAYGIVGAGLHSVQTVPVCLGLGAAGLLIAQGRRPVAILIVLASGVPLLWLPRQAAPDAHDPRDQLRPAARIAATVDLIDQVGGWLAAPEKTVLFTADAGSVRQWRLAVLDHYDGDTWRSTGRIVPAGLGVPPYRGPVPAGAVTQRIKLDSLRGPYLPAADRPVRVAAPVNAVDPDTGVLLASEPLGRGTHYSVVSLVRAVATDPADEGDLAIPDDLRKTVRDFLARTPVRPGMRPARQAEVVRDFLRARHRNVAGAPASATVPAIRAFLADGGSGATVQFATAFTLAMRAQGMPARLVVGFQAQGPAVHARDVRVWTEVRYATVGWVRYDPTPPLTAPASSARERARPEPVTTAVPEPTATPTRSPRPGVTAPINPLLLALLAGVVTLAVMIALIPVARRAWRRRKRRSGDARVVAAWHDVLDAYAPPERHTLTPAQLRDCLAERIPATAAESSRMLSRLADNALYSPYPCSPEDGDAAWRSATELRRSLRRQSAVSPAPRARRPGGG